jgi:hypothetical protein
MLLLDLDLIFTTFAKFGLQYSALVHILGQPAQMIAAQLM